MILLSSCSRPCECCVLFAKSSTRPKPPISQLRAPRSEFDRVRAIKALRACDPSPPSQLSLIQHVLSFRPPGLPLVRPLLLDGASRRREALLRPSLDRKCRPFPLPLLANPPVRRSEVPPSSALPSVRFSPPFLPHTADPASLPPSFNPTRLLRSTRPVYLTSPPKAVSHAVHHPVDAAKEAAHGIETKVHSVRPLLPCFLPPELMRERRSSRSSRRSLRRQRRRSRRLWTRSRLRLRRPRCVSGRRGGGGS